MKINDIDYEYFQTLLNKAEALDKILKDKYIMVSPYNNEFYIALTEEGLINQFQSISNTAKHYSDTIGVYCAENKIHPSEFMRKYKPL